MEMTDNALALIDPGALVIVLAGTLLATIARCGFRDVRIALGAFARLSTKIFDEGANRAALARCTSDIQRRGHLCADLHLPPDRSFAELVKAYQVNGSIEALHSKARAERSTREIARARAVRVFDFAGELAPVFGLVGTLFAISQLGPSEGLDAATLTMSAVATAVLSSLYGVLAAHLFCVPLAGAIERRGVREEEARSRLLEWFEGELTGHSVRVALTGMKNQGIKGHGVRDAA